MKKIAEREDGCSLYEHESFYAESELNLEGTHLSRDAEWALIDDSKFRLLYLNRDTIEDCLHADCDDEVDKVMELLRPEIIKLWKLGKIKT